MGPPTNPPSFAPRSHLAACPAPFPVKRRHAWLRALTWAALIGAGVSLAPGCAGRQRPGSTRTEGPASMRQEGQSPSADVEALALQVSDLVRAKRYPEARLVVDRILARDPRNLHALRLRSLLTGPAPAAEDPEDARIQAQLGRTVEGEVKLEGVPLGQALAEFARRTGIDLSTDWQALESAGIDPKTPVSAHLRNQSAGRVLERILESAGDDSVRLGYAVADGVMTVTTRDNADRNVVTRVYDIRDLIVDVPNFTDAPAYNLDRGGGGGGGGLFSNSRGGGSSYSDPAFGGMALYSGGGGYGRGSPGLTGRVAQGGPVGGKPLPPPPPPPVRAPAPAPAPSRNQLGAVDVVDEEVGRTREEMVEEVTTLMRDTIDPDSWRDNGGSVGSARHLSGQLVVTHTREGHRGIAELLDELREMRAAEVADAMLEAGARDGPRAPAGGDEPVRAEAPPPPPPAQPQPQPSADTGNEAYERVVDNPFLRAVDNPLSTFSIDVDTASYANARRFLTGGSLPPPESVRIEEFVNYFPYRYQGPPAQSEAPFAAAVEVAGCPWNAGHRLVRVALKGKEIAPERRPPANLVFLIDVSGSMNDPNKLPLVKDAMKLLAGQLADGDRVALAVYAGTSGLVLPSTPAKERDAILGAIDRLEAGGSTNGGEGIELAYTIAAENFIKDGINRVVLCTDGDFNVGVTDRGQLTKLIEEKAKTGVFLSVLGFGMGNLKDATMEQLADRGNGNYGYVDTLREANKLLVEQMSGTLVTIAKDVKIQVEFNPAVAGSYRLIGYENRLLAKEDFNDDRKDAGEIGAGHAVTALYEVVPAGAERAGPGVDPLKYQKVILPGDPANDERALRLESAKIELEQKELERSRVSKRMGEGQADTDDLKAAELAVRQAQIAVKLAERDAPPPATDELLTLKLRYKAPDGDTSKLLEFPVKDGGATFVQSSEDFKFAAAVAAFGMILRGSEHKGTASYDQVLELAAEGKGPDEGGYRAEFLELAKKAKELAAGR